jgi:hypothetical protein
VSGSEEGTGFGMAELGMHAQNGERACETKQRKDGTTIETTERKEGGKEGRKGRFSVGKKEGRTDGRAAHTHIYIYNIIYVSKGCEEDEPSDISEGGH